MLSRKVFLIMLNQGLGAILGVVSLVLVGRYIPKEDFGTVGFVLGLVGMLTFIADLGFSHAHVKRMTEGRDEGECMGAFVIAKLVLCVLLVAATFVMFFFWEEVFGLGYQNPDTPHIARIILGYYFMVGLLHIFIFTFQARLQTALQEIPTFVLNITRFGALVVVALGGLGIYWLAGTYLLAGAASLITAILLFWRHRLPIKRPSRATMRSYISFALPLVISSSFLIIALNTDKVMIQLFWNSREVADYFMSQRIIFMVMGLSTAVGALLFPAISQAAMEGKMREVRRLTKDAERYLSMIILPILLFFAVFPTEILHIIGDGYLSAAPILRLHAAYGFFFAMYNIYLFQLNGLNRPRITAKVSILVSVLNIGLNALFIPSSLFGLPLLGLKAEGAVLATMLSTAIGFLVVRFYSHRLTGMKVNWRLLIHIFAALITSIILLALARVIPPSRVFILAPYFFVGVGVFAAVLYLLRELKKEDMDHLLDTINPKEMARYVHHEVKHGKTRP
ncbi:MAG: flippase [Thermoplasmata archaeon]|nr:flippase [Thermoplasmata archaeon]